MLLQHLTELFSTKFFCDLSVFTFKIFCSFKAPKHYQGAYFKRNMR